MNDFREYKNYCDRYIAHHGIKGQHWGVRNGPPYPLGSGKTKLTTKDKIKRKVAEIKLNKDAKRRAKGKELSEKEQRERSGWVPVSGSGLKYRYYAQNGKIIKVEDVENLNNAELDREKIGQGNFIGLDSINNYRLPDSVNPAKETNDYYDTKGMSTSDYFSKLESGYFDKSIEDLRKQLIDNGENERRDRDLKEVYDQLQNAGHIDKKEMQLSDVNEWMSSNDYLDNISDINPGWTQDPYNRRSGTTNNCMHCSSAYALKRMGYNVEAGKTSEGYQNSAMTAWFNGSKQYNESKDSALNRLNSFGRKSFGSVMIEYTVPDENGKQVSLGGHALNFDHDSKGNLFFVDGQSGRVTAKNLDELYSYYGLNPQSKLTLTRLDDTNPNWTNLGKTGVVNLSTKNLGKNELGIDPQRTSEKDVDWYKEHYLNGGKNNG